MNILGINYLILAFFKSTKKIILIFSLVASFTPQLLVQEIQTPITSLVVQARVKSTSLVSNFNSFLNLLSHLKSFESLPLQGMNLVVIIPFSGLISLSIYWNSLFISDQC